MRYFHITATFLRRAFYLFVSLLFIIPHLMFHTDPVEAHGNVDQSFNPTSFGQGCSGLGGFSGQWFTPTADNISAFDIYFFGAGGASGVGTVFSITDWPNTSNILATAPPSTTADGLAHFHLPSKLSITPGQTYAIIKTGGPDTCFRVTVIDDGFYPGGNSVSFGGSQDSNYDLTFTTYSAPPDIAAPSVNNVLITAPVDGFMPSDTAGLFVGESLLGSQPVTVTGEATDDSGIASLTVNGIDATITGNTFSVVVPLVEGENVVTLIAKDPLDHTTTLNGTPTLSFDIDNDGLANNIDANCAEGGAVSFSFTPSFRFCDTVFGGSSHGLILSKTAGINVEITNAPEPEGVNVEVIGPAGGSANLEFDDKDSNIILESGSYVLTDPDKTIKVQTISGLARIVYVLHSITYTVSISSSSTAEFVEHEDGTATVSALSGNITVNGTPVLEGSPYIIQLEPEDTANPTITIVTPANNSTYLFHQIVNADYSCSDSGSGILSCIGPVANGSPFDTSGVGLKTFSVTGTDNANNTTTVSNNYNVKYDWSGFLQPINADGSSIFKLGSTVPVKFQLISDSASVSNAAAKLYVVKTDNGVEGTIIEAVSNASADSGNTFRYDSSALQYIFNLGTKNLTTGTYKLKVYVGGDNNTGVLQGEIDISLK